MSYPEYIPQNNGNTLFPKKQVQWSNILVLPDSHFRTNTERGLDVQVEEDGTKRPESIAWQNLIDTQEAERLKQKNENILSRKKVGRPRGSTTKYIHSKEEIGTRKIEDIKEIDMKSEMKPEIKSEKGRARRESR